MTSSRLRDLLSAFPALRLLVLGDFFLDRYLVVDPDLAETSIETGLEARQVVEIRNSPGAAGTVTNNLGALGVGEILALGIIGEDGQGYDLEKGLRASRVDTSPLICAPDRLTPTYTKPLNRATGGEMERIDIKNRTPTPAPLEDRLIEALREHLPGVDGVILLDQVQEPDCGVLTARVREAAQAAAYAHPGLLFLADSRTRIHAFRNVIVKPNHREALAAAGSSAAGTSPPDPPSDFAPLREAALALAARTGRPLFVTCGDRGILAVDGGDTRHIPAVQVSGPIDIVGAGDSVSASVAAALAAGASVPEAALLGVLVSSITIRQIGTTGVATPDQVLARFDDVYPAGCDLA